MFATGSFKKGEFIAYYTGRLIDNDEADRLWTKYMFEINGKWTLDGASRRNTARYINHSCRPNAESDVKGHQVIVTAIRKIEPGDEITYNYGKDYFDTFIKPHGCLCFACTPAEKRRRAAAKRVAAAKRAAAKRKATKRTVTKRSGKTRTTARTSTRKAGQRRTKAKRG